MSRIFDSATGKRMVPPMRHRGLVVGVTFSPSERAVLSWSSDGQVRLFNAATGKLLCDPMRHDGQVVGALFSPDGKGVLSFSDDGTVKLWEVARFLPAAG